METLNNLIPYSKGTCATNMDLNSDIITVHPESILPMVDGEIVDHMEEYQVEVIDANGKRNIVKTNTSITIKAKWLCRDPNRMTPPNIRRGAKVMLYRNANTDMYYWEPWTNTDNYQKLETVIQGYSNTQNENEKPTTENTWTQGVSTHEKTVNFIHTTKSDGEKWAYDVNLDAKEGLYNIMDDVGNLIKLDSKNSIIRLQTAEGAFIEINKRNITISCDNLSTNAETSISEQTQNITTNASSGIQSTSPTHQHNGNYQIAGGLSSSPGSGGSGITMTGSMNVIGTRTTTGDQVAGGISQINHTHDGVHGPTGKPKP